MNAYRILSHRVNLGPGGCPIGQWTLIIIGLTFETSGPQRTDGGHGARFERKVRVGTI